tara:strand:- start:2400 stop:2552 length:153 start_codon:yes stop_codon:yes gene_type:complete
MYRAEKVQNANFQCFDPIPTKSCQKNFSWFDLEKKKIILQKILGDCDATS